MSAGILGEPMGDGHQSERADRTLPNMSCALEAARTQLEDGAAFNARHDDRAVRRVHHAFEAVRGGSIWRGLQVAIACHPTLPQFAPPHGTVTHTEGTSGFVSMCLFRSGAEATR